MSKPKFIAIQQLAYAQDPRNDARPDRYQKGDLFLVPQNGQYNSTKISDLGVKGLLLTALDTPGFAGIPLKLEQADRTIALVVSKEMFPTIARHIEVTPVSNIDELVFTLNKQDIAETSQELAL